jgi:hypothetical protein
MIKLKKYYSRLRKPKARKAPWVSLAQNGQAANLENPFDWADGARHQTSSDYRIQPLIKVSVFVQERLCIESILVSIT